MSLPNSQISGFSRRKEENLKQRLAATINLPQFFRRVDAIYETNGAKIVYVDSEFTVATLRDARQEWADSSSKCTTWVVRRAS